MESVDEVEAFYDDSREGVTRLLLDHHADVHRRDGDGWTALHYAVGAGRAAVLLLLEAGADPNAAATDGSKPLHEAVRRMNTGSVATLCRFGADRRAVDHQGRTPAELLAHEDANDEERALILSAMS
jgi:ankyrin repeat protein